MTHIGKMQCFIASIGGINVLQVGNSILSGKNKKDNRADVKKGKNKAVDLGKGSQTLKITINITNENDFKAIYRIATEERYTSVIDKYLGEVKVYIASFLIKHTDKTFGITTIDLSLDIIEEFKGSPDYSGQMSNIVTNVLESLNSDYKNLYIPIPNSIPPIKDFSDKLDNFISKVTRYTTAPIKFTNLLMKLKTAKMNLLNTLRKPYILGLAIQNFINNVKDLTDFSDFDIFLNIPIFKKTKMRLEIYEPIGDITSETIGSEAEYIHNINLTNEIFNKLAIILEVKELTDSIYYYKNTDDSKIDKTMATIKPINEPNEGGVRNLGKNINGVIHSEINEDLETHLKNDDISTSNMINNIKITRKDRVLELQSNLFKRLNTIRDIQNIGNISTIKDLNKRYIDTEYIKSIIQLYIHNTPINNIITINIKEKQPIIVIIFAIYGTLKYLNDIIELNKLSDLEEFVGDLKIII